MVQDAAREGQCIGMALLKEGWESDYYGNPPIFPLGCVGRLMNVQPLPDGRSNILLQGLERYEIQEEFHDRRYRRARIALRPCGDDRSIEPALRTKLEQDLERYVGARENSHVWKEFLRQGVSDDSLVQRVSSYLDCTPLEQQLLLESETLHQQTRRLLDLIHFKMHEQHGVKGWG
jgi:Lon protease-like protein